MYVCILEAKRAPPPFLSLASVSRARFPLEHSPPTLLSSHHSLTVTNSSPQRVAFKGKTTGARLQTLPAGEKGNLALHHIVPTFPTRSLRLLHAMHGMTNLCPRSRTVTQLQSSTPVERCSRTRFTTGRGSPWPTTLRRHRSRCVSRGGRSST